MILRSTVPPGHVRTVSPGFDSPDGYEGSRTFPLPQNEREFTMATRAPRAAAKLAPVPAPAESPIEVPTTLADTRTGFPAAWGSDNVEIFAGHDLTDKKELVGVPFLITGVEIERNEERAYDIAYVYAIDVNGTEFEFSDTSNSGVRTQIQAFMVEKGLNPAPGAGHQAMRLAVMKGLRVSEFKVVDEETGKNRNAAVYYLTAGVRKTV
jgi:hypothetical protein